MYSLQAAFHYSCNTRQLSTPLSWLVYSSCFSLFQSGIKQPEHIGASSFRNLELKKENVDALYFQIIGMLQDDTLWVSFLVFMYDLNRSIPRFKGSYEGYVSN